MFVLLHSLVSVVLLLLLQHVTPLLSLEKSNNNSPQKLNRYGLRAQTIQEKKQTIHTHTHTEEP